MYLIRQCYWFCILALPSVLIAQQSTSSSIPQSPKYEVRAVWITTVGGLDWPKSTDSSEQKRSLREMVAQVKAANFNTIFFQVRGRGDALYRSQYEPWARHLTGTLGKDPGWDPLQFILAEARAAGLEVHAWFNTFLVRSGSAPSTSSPLHVVQLHPDWARRINGDWWLDPGLPQVRAYLIKVVMDIVRSYDVDGIHFDYIRYPGLEFSDESTYKRYGAGTPKDQWRRENVNVFVRAVYDSIRSAKWMIKVGSTPIGIYAGIPNGRGLGSYHSLFQDSRLWLQEHKHDYLVPQVYWSMGNTPDNPDFESIAIDWSNNTLGRHIYIGIAAYKLDVFKTLPELIDATRRAGLQGNSFFRYEHISQLWRVGERYRVLALVPPMPWKDPWPPQPPGNLQVQELGDGKYSVMWSRSQPASDGDSPKRYVVYRSPSHPVDIADPVNIVAVTTQSETSFVDVISRPISMKYYYAVTALDKLNNESEPTREGMVIVSEMRELLQRIPLKTTVGEVFSHKDNKAKLLPYELGEWVTVSLTILDSSRSPVKWIFEDIRGSGKYVDAINVVNWKVGLYFVQLNIGSTVFTKPFRVVEEARAFDR